MLISTKMRNKLTESIEIPAGVNCSFSGVKFECSKGSTKLSRVITLPNILIKIDGKNVTFECAKANKNELKRIKSQLAHLKNLFDGLDKKYTYKLQACNVHFPMTLKVEGSRLAINNFLGEKKSRYANIVPGVEVDVKGQNLTITSHDREAAGQTAANIETATKVRNRDRRIFQDGIYIVERPGRNE